MIEALVSLLTVGTLLNVLWATLAGIVIGALPGLTATMGLALMVSLTYSMSGEQAILVLVCIYVGSIYGGSRSAILLNIPGTPANAATAVEGFPMALKGEAGRALGLATVASFVGSLFGALCLWLIAPILSEAALRFGSYEYFLLGLFGILIAGRMTAADDPIKGWIAGFVGLLVAAVGQETFHAYDRLSFGSSDLSGGIALIPAMVGLFGITELIVSLTAGSARIAPKTSKNVPVLSLFADLWVARRTVMRSNFIGTAIGIIPGVGEDVAAWIAYAAARRASRTPEEYTKGCREGLIAAETSNSAALPGAIIPALTLAVPGSAPAAVLLAAMFIHNVRPGPMIMIENPGFVASMVWFLVFASIAMAVLGLVMTRPLLMVLKIRKEYLTPVVFTLCLLGPYALSQRLFDLYVMLVFGVIGFLLRQMKYPMAPLILGLILGGMIDQNFRRALVLAARDPVEFATRPITVALIVLCLATLFVGGGTMARVRGLFGRRSADGGRA
jgi:putative tricarboxylic transport membrane protein